MVARCLFYCASTEPEDYILDRKGTHSNKVPVVLITESNKEVLRAINSDKEKRHLQQSDY